MLYRQGFCYLRMCHNTVSGYNRRCNGAHHMLTRHACDNSIILAGAYGQTLETKYHTKWRWEKIPFPDVCDHFAVVFLANPADFALLSPYAAAPWYGEHDEPDAGAVHSRPRSFRGLQEMQGHGRPAWGRRSHQWTTVGSPVGVVSIPAASGAPNGVS